MSDLPVTSVSGRDGWNWEDRINNNTADVTQRQSTSTSKSGSIYNYNSNQFDSLPLRRQVMILKRELETKERRLEQKEEQLNAVIEQYEQKLRDAKEACSGSTQEQSDKSLLTSFSLISDSS